MIGFSRLMGEDEIGTLTALKELRADVVDPIIANHRGRIVKLMGDGALVEFASVVDRYLMCRNVEYVKTFTESLREAGLPE